MKYSKIIKKTLLSFFMCLLIASPNKAAYILIEQSTPGVIGSVLGGVTAGISVIFGVLISIKRTKNIVNFTDYLQSLKGDMKILIFCLAASILLPYLRVTGLPMLTYPTHDLLPSKDKFITALELWVIFLSLSLIIEVIGCLILVLKLSLAGKSNE